jgi:hypothetical protein
MASPPNSPQLTIDVVELNGHAPRPFVFTEAALCLRDSIRAAGLGSNHYVNVADADSICIVLGALPPLLEPLEQLDPRKTMIFNLEQLGSTSAVISADYVNWLRNRLVLDYHSHNVEHLRRANGPAQQALELPIVPSASLLFRPDLPAEKTVDVLFFGSLNERRAYLLRQLEDAGLRVESVAGAYADELAPAIRRARVVLHAHFYDTGLFPVTRILQPIAQGVPIVCETSAMSAHSDWSGSGIVFAPFDGLADACRALLLSQAEQRARAEQAQRFAAQLDFAGPLESVLQALAARLGAPRRPAPPRLIDPPRPAPHSGAAADATLPTEEIEAILAREAGGLPPPADLDAAPLALVQRQPGQGRLGRWLVWLLIAFSVASVIQAMR